MIPILSPSFSLLAMSASLALVILVPRLEAQISTLKDAKEKTSDPAATGAIGSIEDLPIPDTLRIPSLSIHNADIRDVFQGLSMQYGVNLILSPEVKGSISVQFNGIRLKDAIRLIAEENGYDLSLSHDVIRVDKPSFQESPAPISLPLSIVYQNGKLSVDMQKAPTDTVIRELSRVTGRNIIIEPDVKGGISGFFKDLELRKGLRVLAEINGMTLLERDGVFILRPNEEKDGRTAESGSRSGRFRVLFEDGKVSIEAADAELSELIASLASRAGISLVIYAELKGNSTLRVNAIDIDEAFRILLRGTEYSFWSHQGTRFVGPQSMQLSVHSRLIPLSHMKASDALELLPPSLVREAQIKVVKSSNALMVLGSVDVLDGISRYLAQVDLPIPQILIEALVVDVNLDRIRRYGIDMLLGQVNLVRGQERIFPDIRQTLDKAASQKIIDALPGVRDVVTLPKNFLVQVEALEQEGALKVRSRPQIATLNGSEATMSIGQIQYYVLKSETDYAGTTGTTTQTTERFEKIEANITLTVTPFVTGLGEIKCDILPDFSEPEGKLSADIPPTINRRILKSKVNLRDGETIVLGGLVQESEHTESRRLPFLSSIPWIGGLFRNITMIKSRNQLLIFVTPRVYRESESATAPAGIPKMETSSKSPN